MHKRTKESTLLGVMKILHHVMQTATQWILEIVHRRHIFLHVPFFLKPTLIKLLTSQKYKMAYTTLIGLYLYVLYFVCNVPGIFLLYVELLLNE